jgi:carbon storage regulator
MLVLSRKAGESICIGEDITVEIRRVAGNRVTIALHAPRDVRILRGELQQAALAFAEADAAEIEIDLNPATDGQVRDSFADGRSLLPLARAV